MNVTLPPKPKFGSPCNGCGLCCAVELCGVAEIMHPGASAPCPSLKISPGGTRTYCELMAVEQVYELEPVIQRVLGAGLGCSMPDDAPTNFGEAFKLTP